MEFQVKRRYINAVEVQQQLQEAGVTTNNMRSRPNNEISNHKQRVSTKIANVPKKTVKTGLLQKVQPPQKHLQQRASVVRPSASTLTQTDDSGGHKQIHHPTTAAVDTPTLPAPKSFTRRISALVSRSAAMASAMLSRVAATVSNVAEASHTKIVGTAQKKNEVPANAKEPSEKIADTGA